MTIGAPGTVNFGTLTFTATCSSLDYRGQRHGAGRTNTAGSVSVTSGGSLTVNGDVTTNNGTIALIANSLTNNATISNSGGTTNILLRADAFDLDGTGGTGQVQGGSGAVVVTPIIRSRWVSCRRAT